MGTKKGCKTGKENGDSNLNEVTSPRLKHQKNTKKRPNPPNRKPHRLLSTTKYLGIKKKPSIL